MSPTGRNESSDRQHAVERARRPLDRDVADTIARQNAALPPSPARDRHVAELRDGAAAVVTGQQVGLFLGPLFNVYKAASAIRLASTLRAETGVPVVPVFWLQTEDHDLPEIAVHHTLAAGGTPISLHVPADPEDRRSVAHRQLPPETAARLEDLRAALAPLPHGAAHVERIARHYRPGVPWSAAFAAMMAELFADAGLVFVDPRDRGFAKAQRNIHERALELHADIATRLERRSEDLRNRGIPTPVHVRSGAPLAFFHPSGPEGPRYRLEPDGDGFREVGGPQRLPLRGLQQHLRDEPLSFSTSALLRPILQDTLLPTVAYIGGLTEVAYFRQIVPLYEIFEMREPLVLPRASFRLIDGRCRRLLGRWQLDAAACEAPAGDVLRRAVTVADDGEEALARLLLAPFLARLDEIAPKLCQVDSDLATAIDKTRSTVEMAVGKLGSRYDRACRRHNQRLVDDIATLTRILFPDGRPQERFYGLSVAASRFDELELLTRILAAVEPFADGSTQDFELPGDASA